MLDTKVFKARAVLATKVKVVIISPSMLELSCSFVCAERPNFVFVSFPLRRFCLRFHLFLECRLLKLDRNYFNARAMLTVLAIKVANARALLATRVANCSRHQDHQCLPPINLS
jgi:hypothetical protein